MDALERLKSEMAKYGDIEPKERDEKVTLDAQAKALLENAKRLIDALGLIAHNHIRYSSHRAEKGGGAGAFQVDRTTALRAKDVRYVWEVVLPYVRSGRTTVLSKKTENADISYADTSSRGRHWFVPTVGCDGESYGFPRTIGYGMQ